MNLAIQYFFIPAITGLTAAYIAARRKKNVLLWFAIGALFGVLGIFVLFLSPSSKKTPPLQPAALPKPEPYIKGPSDRFWYYLDTAQCRQGPMSYRALTEAWKKGVIAASTLVWHEELTDWKELHELVTTPPNAAQKTTSS
jgi:hypothetical protein